MSRLVCATLLFPLLAACQQQGMSAHLYGPPKGTSPAYWQVAAYSDKPPIGPETARGVLFWSHGVSGQNVQWKGKPLRFVERFAREGWDVIKVNRNNLHERSWNVSGPKHVADLQERARKARSDGYRRVILGGQSYGGAISLEAASTAGLADGVIAIAPGHGSDACGRGYGIGRRADSLPRQLRGALERNRARRTVLMVADGDECVGFNRPHASYRETLNASGSSFVFLDDTMPVRGHFAGNTNQFDRWYGQCLVDFLDAVGAPRAGETVCPSPSPVPAYLLPDGYRPPAHGGPGSLLGAWSGSYSIEKRGTRNLCLLVDRETSGGIRAEVAFGAGSQRKASMVTFRRYFSVDAGSGNFIYAHNKYRMAVKADAERGNVSVTIRTAKGREYRAELERGCMLVDDRSPGKVVSGEPASAGRAASLPASQSRKAASQGAANRPFASVGPSTRPPHLYGPPTGTSPAYWQARAYGDRPPRGPEASKGILFWSHGLWGRTPKWRDKPPRFVRKFAYADWDVVKVNRDERLAYRWAAAGSRHAADLRERAREARKAGYKRIVLGGHSYGAAIALEAASERGIADAVIAVAPNHDSDNCGGIGASGHGSTWLQSQLVNALEDLASPRVVLAAPGGDECLGPELAEGSYKNALVASGSSFVLLDDAMPIRGRKAGRTRQFDAWYGECLLDFVGSGEAARAGESVCPLPDPVPTFLLPAGYTPPSPTGSNSLVGAWGGEYFVSSRGVRNFCMFIEEEYEDGFKARTAFGAGSERVLSMETYTRIFYRFGGDREFVYDKNKYRMTLFDDPDRRELELAIRTASGTGYHFYLTRGCKLVEDRPRVG